MLLLQTVCWVSDYYFKNEIPQTGDTGTGTFNLVFQFNNHARQ